jgi:hypothetical protein
MNPRRLRHCEHPGLHKRVLESFWLQDTIRAGDSTVYGPGREPKESVDQHSGVILSCCGDGKNVDIRSGDLLNLQHTAVLAAQQKLFH